MSRNVFSRIRSLFDGLFNKLFHRNELYYINGSETLPPPLDPEIEEQMIRNIECDYARQTLIEHNLRLVAYIAKRFENTGANIEELISIGTVGLMKAVSTFNSDKNIKLATYASRCIENEILMYLRKNQRVKQEYSLDEVLSVDSEGNEMILSDVLWSDEPESLDKLTAEEDKENLYRAINKLNKREKEIIIMRFGLFGKTAMTQKEVADALGISQSYISRLEKRIFKKLKENLKDYMKV